MKREGLLRPLRRHGCVLRREGKEHELWENPQTGHAEAIPRHAEIANLLVRKICRKLSISRPAWISSAGALAHARSSQAQQFDQMRGRPPEALWQFVKNLRQAVG
jgi:mRNA interferase HicA